MMAKQVWIAETRDGETEYFSTKEAAEAHEFKTTIQSELETLLISVPLSSADIEYIIDNATGIAPILNKYLEKRNV